MNQFICGIPIRSLIQLAEDEVRKHAEHPAPGDLDTHTLICALVLVLNKELTKLPTTTIRETSSSEVDYKAVLLSFIASLTLCDHMGDVESDIIYALESAKIDLGEWEERYQLRTKLGKIGVKTLNGIDLGRDDV